MQRINLNDLQHQKTTSQLVVEQIQQLTSFPLEMCQNHYDNMKHTLSDEQIIAHYKGLKDKQIDKIRMQTESVNDLLNYDIKQLNESQHQQFFIDKFSTIDDVYSRLNIAKNLMEKSNVNDVDNIVPIFEGIQHNLSYVSKFYAPDNMYQTIMQNVNRIVAQNELKKTMIMNDNTFYIDVLNSLFTASNDGFYNNISTIEKTISDTQTLLFDLALFVAKFVDTKEYDLKFINTKTVNEYHMIASELFKNLYSSSKSSRLINKDYLFDSTKTPHSITSQLIGSIDEQFFVKINVDLYNINQKAVHDSLKLIGSMTHLFKQPLTRRLISKFVTKSTQLVTDVDKAISMRRMAGHF